MACLLDTGILLRAFDVALPEHEAIHSALERLRRVGVPLFVAIQNISEFWNVSTRPEAQNGFGLGHARVRKRIELIEANCQVLTKSPESYVIWKRLVEDRSITGVAVHDARLVSVMLVAGITKILTLNERDFRRYSEINAVSPIAIASG